MTPSEKTDGEVPFPGTRYRHGGTMIRLRGTWYQRRVPFRCSGRQGVPLDALGDRRSRPHLLPCSTCVLPDHRHRGVSAEGRDLVVGAAGMGQLLNTAVPQRVEIVIQQPQACPLLAHDARRLEVAEGTPSMIREDRDPGARRCVEGVLQLEGAGQPEADPGLALGDAERLSVIV